ncbi:FecR family protein [Sphingobacterium nematocida]|uniref:FecR family protein n=2 Tax=Sphingobacterium nematocida TaxID=1513896 RepID=A0A1T5EKQ0_9SPHI|nr:FecR family protein [Sphingobacterium nematocida]
MDISYKKPMILEAHNPYINHLFQRYLEGRYSEEDLDTLLAYFKLDEDSEQLRELIEQQFEKPILDVVDQEEVRNSVARIGKELEQKINPSQKAKPFKWWYAAAAVLFFFSITGIYLYNTSQVAQVPKLTSIYGDDVAPGGNRATITLSNGTLIELSADQDGVIASGSELSYSDGRKILDATKDIQYATLQTPRGGQYRLTLPDGSKVILNAESTLRYPNSFVNLKNREVSLSGEAYFEVAKDKQHPFIVLSAQQKIEVLGTHFNVSSYHNEETTLTTLVEGSVRVNNSILKPNQQSVLKEGQIRIREVDVEQAIAWKNGYLMFDDEPLYSIMQKIERWYDVEVVYAPGVDQTKRYGGGVSRYDAISKVLDKLKLTGSVHFKIEGRKITVMK